MSKGANRVEFYVIPEIVLQITRFFLLARLLLYRDTGVLDYGSATTSQFGRTTMADEQQLLEVTTPLKMIWFTRVRGFHVHSKRRIPRASITGSIRYRDVWLLAP